MTYKPVGGYEQLRREALSDPETLALYEATTLQIELSIALKKARQKRKMTQDNVAKLLHTKKPAISRLESGETDVKHFPSLLTIAKFAAAVGCRLNINLVSIKNAKPLKLKHEEVRAR
jgi:transcriptional regulator with XRE-family HTH domain